MLFSSDRTCTSTGLLEFDEFIDLMNFDPDKNLGQFFVHKKRFDELLDILHKNKFGFSMYDNFKIRSILESDGFDRVYLNGFGSYYLHHHA